MIELLIRAAATDLLLRQTGPSWIYRDVYLAACSLAYWPNPDTYFSNRNLS